ncbi:hypothetical protein [Pseudomonas putida]|uniref:Uncharacterized protein n=1 Tax=Pseudomonas putida TaxID=303 RepID=A0A8I1ED91_PSEPU|nr:hypothetical protein [Pseudomonas putida]MBI6883232.1 hypothetical protein [Pseudomonas putida]
MDSRPKVAHTPRKAILRAFREARKHGYFAQFGYMADLEGSLKAVREEGHAQWIFASKAGASSFGDSGEVQLFWSGDIDLLIRLLEESGIKAATPVPGEPIKIDTGREGRRNIAAQSLDESADLPKKIQKPAGRSPVNGATCVRVAMKSLVETDLSQEQADALWAELKGWLKKRGSQNTVQEVEECVSGNLDTWPRDVLMNALASVMVGGDYWPNEYPGSRFAFDFIKECISRNYLDSDKSLGDEPPSRFKIHTSDGVKPITQEVVHAAAFDALEKEVAELKRQLAEKSVPADVQLAADRWNALLSSPRLSVLGSAGFYPTDHPGALKAHLDGYRHFGCNFWSDHPPLEDNTFTESAKVMITTYADHMIERSKNG